jgi:alanyl-tRNA synthetase
MTVKLYDKDPYLKDFSAKVTRLTGNFVELDQTAFYAEAGGQSGDSGVLNGEKVNYTKFDGDRHLHIMENEPSLQIGESVNGVIDWERRYRIMKLHSASHIMEYFLWENFGYMERQGSFVDDKKDRADYEHEGRLDPDKLKKTEQQTNEFLTQGYPITITVDEQGIRNWKCRPVDMHCAGTHVKNTAEIGLITLKRKNPGQGIERIETSLKQ